MRSPRKYALVLAGGGARGAYQVGVIRYLREGLPEPARSRVRFQILSGSSVGAVNGAFLATTMHRPAEQGRLLQQCWDGLHADGLMHLGWSRLLGVLGWITGRRLRRRYGLPHAAVFNVEPLISLVRDRFAWSDLPRNISQGLLDALTISTTDIASGKTYTFVQTHDGRIPPWARDWRRVGVAARIGPEHALASAAIPLLFPPVAIGGRLFCDGGLRLMAPLSPALRLGADHVLVVSLRHISTAGPDTDAEQQSALQAFPGALFLLSKTLSSLLLDQLDQDLRRLEVVNSILECGVTRYGPEFVTHLNQAVTRVRGTPYRRTHALVLRPSQDPGLMAARHAERLSLRTPTRQLLKLGLKLVAPAEERAKGDLLSYVLFDEPYINELIALGYNDAAAHEKELVAFFSPGDVEHDVPTLVGSPQGAW